MSLFACLNGTRTAVCIGINNRPRYRIRCQAMHSISYRRHAPRARSGRVADVSYHHGRQQQTGVRGYQKRWCAHQRAPIILTDDLFHLSTSPSLGRAKLSVLGSSQSCECWLVAIDRSCPVWPSAASSGDEESRGSRQVLGPTCAGKSDAAKGGAAGIFAGACARCS